MCSRIFYSVAEHVVEARKTAEFRQMGSYAKKSVDDVKHCERLTRKCKGLRCDRGRDKLVNGDGFLKWISEMCGLFDPMPEIESMRQHEKIAPHLVECLDTRLNVEQSLQDRAHKDAGNSFAKVSFMRTAVQPYFIMSEYNGHRKPERTSK